MWKYDHFRPWWGDLTLTQLIFDGFATSSEVARNESLTLADAFQVKGTDEDIALLATKAYLDVIRSRRLIAVAQSNYNAHRKTYGMIKKRSDSGLARVADVTQAAGRLALAKTNLLAAKNNVQDADVIYYKVTGLSPKNLRMPASPKPVALPQKEQLAINKAVDGHPLLKSAKADITEAEAQHRAALAPFYPKFDVVLDAAQGEDTDGNEGHYHDYIGFLRVQYNLFRGGSDVARKRQTAYLVEQAKQTRNKTYDEVVENMQLAWDFFTTSKSQIGYFKKHQVASLETVIAYRKQFQLNKRTLLDLLDSEEESFRSQNDYINGQFNLLLSKFRILNAEGKLVSYLQIPQQYDLHTPQDLNDLNQIYDTTKPVANPVL